jgi:hypothetical protein
MYIYKLRINFSPFIPGLKAGEFPAEIVKYPATPIVEASTLEPASP